MTALIILGVLVAAVILSAVIVVVGRAAEWAWRFPQRRRVLRRLK